MQVEVRRRLGDLSGDWDRLVAAQDLPSPFLLSWWLDGASAATPTIVCCTEDGRLVGGAAFEADMFGPGPLEVPRLRFLGQGLLEPDHLDLVAAEGHLRPVLAAVVAWVRSSPRMWDLDGLAGHSPLVAALGGTVISTIPAPYLRLTPGSDPVAALPGRLRSTVNRTTKRLARDGIHARRVPADDGDRALGTLLDLHESRWKEDSGFAGGWERFRRAAAVGIASGDVVVHELADDSGRVVASELELVVGDRVAFYQAGRLTDHELRGSGSALKAEVLRWAAGRGSTEFDLLRGDEPYKHDWASDRRDVVRLRGGCGATGRLAAAVANGTVAAAPRVRSAVARVAGEERADAVNRRLIRLVRG